MSPARDAHFLKWFPKNLIIQIIPLESRGANLADQPNGLFTFFDFGDIIVQSINSHIIEVAIGKMSKISINLAATSVTDVYIGPIWLHGCTCTGECL